jgi:hypothetical protein
VVPGPPRGSGGLPPPRSLPLSTPGSLPLHPFPSSRGSAAGRCITIHYKSLSSVDNFILTSVTQNPRSAPAAHNHVARRGRGQPPPPVLWPPAAFRHPHNFTSRPLRCVLARVTLDAASSHLSACVHVLNENPSGLCSAACLCAWPLPRRSDGGGSARRCGEVIRRPLLLFLPLMAPPFSVGKLLDEINK